MNGMNLLLRPLNDVNDVTWSIIISIIILLIGVGYYIYTIMTLAYEELSEKQENCSLFDTFTDDNAVYYYSSYSESGDEGEHY